jgi:hypothetical protein
MGTGVISGEQSGWGVKLTAGLYLVTRLRMRMELNFAPFLYAFIGTTFFICSLHN